MPCAGRRPTVLLVATTLVVATLVGVGCAKERATSDPTLTKREYIARANELQQDAAKVFTALDGKLAATPAAAKVHLAAFDELIAGYQAFDPPRDWRDEHEAMLEALATMRQSAAIVSKASARNRKVITIQVGRYQDAQQDFEQAVRSINASR